MCAVLRQRRHFMKIANSKKIILVFPVSILPGILSPYMCDTIN